MNLQERVTDILDHLKETQDSITQALVRNILFRQRIGPDVEELTGRKMDPTTYDDKTTLWRGFDPGPRMRGDD